MLQAEHSIFEVTYFYTEILCPMIHEHIFDDINKVEPKLHLTFMSNHFHGTQSLRIK